MRAAPRSRLLRHATLALLPLWAGCSRAAPQAAADGAVPVTPVVAAQPYHAEPTDTVEVAVYRAWQQYMLQCARCHGEEAQGSSFGPSLLQSLRPDGTLPTREAFLNVLINGRPEKGMPAATGLGVDPAHFEGLYQYLKGRSDGRLLGGRPAQREG